MAIDEEHRLVAQMPVPGTALASAARFARDDLLAALEIAPRLRRMGYQDGYGGSDEDGGEGFRDEWKA